MAGPRSVVIVEATSAARVARFRERFEHAAREAVAARGRFACALTGGSTPGAYYPALKDAEVPWARTHVFWGDERVVDPEHPDSNYRLARETFLDGVPIPAENQHRIEGEGADLERVLARAKAALFRAAGDPPVFDVVHLGIGPDGHVASLFPGRPALDDPSATVRVVRDSPKPPPLRVTVTLPVLTHAREVWLFADARKADLVRGAVHDAASALPLARVVREAQGTLVWFTDAEAAAAVEGR